MVPLMTIFACILVYFIIGFVFVKTCDSVHKYLYGHLAITDGGGVFLAVSFWPLLFVVVSIYLILLLPFKASKYLYHQWGWCVVSYEVDDMNEEITQDVVNFLKTIGTGTHRGFFKRGYGNKDSVEQIKNYLETTGWRKVFNANDNLRYYSKFVRVKDVIKLKH